MEELSGLKRLFPVQGRVDPRRLRRARSRRRSRGRRNGWRSGTQSRLQAVGQGPEGARRAWMCMMRSWWLSPVRRSSSRAAQVRAGGTSACAQRLRVTARSHNIVRRTPAPVARAGAGKEPAPAPRPRAARGRPRLRAARYVTNGYATPPTTSPTDMPRTVSCSTLRHKRILTGTDGYSVHGESERFPRRQAGPAVSARRVGRRRGTFRCRESRVRTGGLHCVAELPGARRKEPQRRAALLPDVEPAPTPATAPVSGTAVAPRLLPGPGCYPRKSNSVT